jgi:Fic family protein
MSAYFDANKDKYIDLLFNISSNGDWSKWIEFCLEGVVEQSNDTERRCIALLKLSDQFNERIRTIGGSIRLNTIADSLFARPIVRIPYISKMCVVTYPTAEADIDKLVKVGILRQLKDTKVKTYVAIEILKIAYS